MTGQREVERSFLAGEAWPSMLEAAGVTVEPFAAIRSR
jgi:hypothetical protein